MQKYWQVKVLNILRGILNITDTLWVGIILLENHITFLLQE